MGKSTAAAMFRRMGLPVFDADACVHALMAPNGAALRDIAERFPGAAGPAGVDRKALGDAVFADAAALRDLEAILHPRVGAARTAFLAACARRRTRFAVLDVPLLLEGGSDALCDLVVVISAPAYLQRQRVLRRPGMTVEKFSGVLARQMSDAEKRRRADCVVTSALGRRETWRRLRHLLMVACRRRDRS
jgi:dephospho-CoA kinase